MRLSAFSIIATGVLLSACVEQGSLVPEDVLNRSSVANSGLMSARLSVDVSLVNGDEQAGAVSASLNVQGSVQQGGRQLDLGFVSQGAGTSGAQPLTWDAAGRLIVLSENESYIRVEKLDAQPVLPLPATIVGSWFRLPSAGQSSADITPDPRYLRLQSEAVRVTKDRGITTVGGRRMYHYEVAIDPSRLAAYLASLPEAGEAEAMAQTLSLYEATGEIWIDEETFLLSQAAWNIRKKNDGAFSLRLTMHLSDPGLPVTVTAPDDAQPFPVTPFLPAADAVILQEF